MRYNLEVFAVVFIAVFSASLLSQYLGGYIFAGDVAEEITEGDGEQIEKGMEEPKKIVISLPPVERIAIEEEPLEKERAPCEGVSCASSNIVCPDGFRDRCKNFCIPETGRCTDCTPSCAGHGVSGAGSNAVPEWGGEAGPEDPGPEKPEPIESVGANIVDIKYDADGDDRLKGNWNTEWVVVGGSGDLGGWSLSDEGGHVFVFPNGFVLSGSVTVHSGDGENTQADLYWNGGRRPIWNNGGDKATLKDRSGNVVDEYSY